MKTDIECISCGSGEFETIAVNNEFSMPRDIIRCKHCCLAFVSPLPDIEEIQEFYSREYSLKYKSYRRKSIAGDLIDLFSFFFMNIRIKERLHYLAGENISIKNKNILEIGSADGRFLQALKKRGANVWAVDPSKREAVASIRKFNIAPIAATAKGLLPAHENTYDIIFSYHVLEHLRDPLGELKDIKRLLRKGGYFIGEVPFTPRNVTGLEEVIKKSVFDNLHLFHFGTQAVSNLLRKAGFVDINIGRLEIKSMFKKLYPRANIHYLHPSFERGITVKLFSLLQAVELGAKNLLNRPAMGEQALRDLEAEWIGPNDWVRFNARA